MSRLRSHSKRLVASALCLLLLLTILPIAFGSAAWTQTESLSDNTNSSYDARIAIGPDGVVHVVWREGNTRFMYSNLSDGAWSVPIEAVTYPAFQGANPDIAVGPDNVLHLVYTVSFKVYYKSFNGSWSTAEGVFTNTSGSSHSQVDVGPDGTVHVTGWEEIGDNHYLRYRNKTTAWNAEHWVGAHATWLNYIYPERVDMAAADNGDVHVVFTNISVSPDTRVEHISLQGGAWSSTEALSADNGARNPRIAYGPGGIVHVFFVDFVPVNQYNHVYRYLEGGVWSTSEQVSFGGGDANRKSSIAVADDGRVHAVWSQSGGQLYNNNIILFHNTRTDGQWGSNTVIPSGLDVSINDPHMAISPDGAVHVVWPAIVNSNMDIHYNALLLLANAGADISLNEGGTASFNGTGTLSARGVQTYNWTFTYDGSPQTLSGATPTFQFLIPGSYAVTLNVTDTDGSWDVDTMTVTVNDTTAPSADAGPDQFVSAGSSVTFNGSASTDNMAVTGYSWNFTYDSAPQTLAGVAPVFNFLLPGVYVVTLNVTDDAGNWNEDTMTVTVNDTSAPNANAGSNQTVNSGATVTFDGAASTDNLGITAYNWTFTYNGTVQNLSGVSPTFLFVTPGVYQVTLNTTDAAGNWNEDTMTVTVNTTLSIGPVTAGDTILAGANITVSFGDQEFHAVTDEGGNATFFLPPEAIGEQVTVTVDATGHSTKSTTFTLADMDEQEALAIDVSDIGSPSNMMWPMLVLLAVMIAAAVIYRRVKA